MLVWRAVKFNVFKFNYILNLYKSEFSKLITSLNILKINYIPSSNKYESKELTGLVVAEIVMNIMNG
jgi:hypothetical protein